MAKKLIRHLKKSHKTASSDQREDVADVKGQMTCCHDISEGVLISAVTFNCPQS